MGNVRLTRPAAFEISNIAGYRLITTLKTQIIGNKILLPSEPEGSVLLNLMMVFDDNGDCGQYDEVTVFTTKNGASYAVLNEPESIVGLGIVSYLTKLIA
jgi:hypothetical protein